MYYVSGGYVPMAVLTLIISIWNAFATQRVVDVIPYLTKPVTEKDDPLMFMMEEALGVTGVVILDFCYLVTLVGGGLVAYEIVFNTLLSGLPWQQWGFALGSSKLFWGIVYFVIVTPLSLLRDLSYGLFSMSFMSIGGLIALLSSIILYVIFGGMHYKIHFETSFLWPRSIKDFAQMFGVCCLCFAVPFYGTSSQRSMDDKEKFPAVLYGSLLFSGFFYIIVGVGCSLLYNQQGIADIFIENIPHSSPFYITAACLLALNSIFSYPIIAYPPVLCIENMFRDGPYEDETNEDKVFVKSWKKWIVRITVLVFVVVVGTFFPRSLTILGSFAVTFGCFALPSFLHWKLIPGLSTAQKVLDWTLVAIGLILMVVTTALSFIHF
ncbi:hypothetical protein JH06_2642 [Blastocystis sp. subtype 4]|uniref:hypothetical protein n=1 Tax=Blastocystis sp. subtype 4 TaxID=944170 RepID=UPI000711F135|nr:hypothetical protein JH06_2642 [Blastocystis sp. subtype 4]KNB43526.1 hypothetical protein JH06_2642 [Blastocystis sp. subtype 4]|eukprot:XP_014526969.1 hypothetical protein JH06_2642 [Blastocystis sp. subtype 4]